MGLLGYVHLFESQGTTESQIIPLKDKTVMSQNGESYIITYSDKHDKSHACPKTTAQWEWRKQRPHWRGTRA